MIKVLDKGYVELQDIMGNDLAIVNAARVSYLGESKGLEQDLKLLEYLMEHKHTSPFEQVEFKFRIKAPVVVWWQLVRHRTFNLNLQSGRYTEYDENEYYLPSEWRLQSKENKQGSEGVSKHSDYFTNMLQYHIEESFMLYQKALDNDIAKEQARLFLPSFCLYHTGIVKVDAHNLMHFLTLRLDNHSQYEIRSYANAIYTIFEEKLPETARLFNIYRRY